MRNKFIFALFSLTTLILFLITYITRIYAVDDVDILLLWSISLIFMIAGFIERNKESKLRQKINIQITGCKINITNVDEYEKENWIKKLEMLERDNCEERKYSGSAVIKLKLIKCEIKTIQKEIEEYFTQQNKEQEVE